MYLLCAPMSHAVQPATRITTIPDNPPNPFNPTNPSSDNELLAHHRRYQIAFNVQTVAVRRPGSADFNCPGYTHGCLCFTRSYLEKPRSLSELPVSAAPRFKIPRAPARHR